MRQDQAATLRPRGHSMAGKVEDGGLVTVEPLGARELRVGDIVLVRIHGREYLHLVKAIWDGHYLIGNNRGRVNGWVGRRAIAGVTTTVTPSRA